MGVGVTGKIGESTREGVKLKVKRTEKRSIL